jgi:predicted DCC family thiol-disulfide oxidoreductase YuxK
MSPRAGRRRSIPSWRCAANSAGFPETSQPKDFCFKVFLIVATTLRLPKTRPIILYDGLCGLCNRFNQFVLKRDRKDLFRFAPLQSSFASGVLIRHGAEPRKLDTVYVVVDYDQPTERLLSKSHAILFTLQQIGGTWRILSAFRMLPRFILDIWLRLNRPQPLSDIREYETCLVPEERYRQKFIDPNPHRG